MKKVMIVAGGTGGHVIPGLTVAKLLEKEGVGVEWIGTLAGIESTLVPQANIRLHIIAMMGLRGKGFVVKLLAPFRLLRAVLQSRKRLKQARPDVVLGFGGYVSAPVGLAARLLKIPLLIHEQNSVVGAANSLLSRFAHSTLTAYPGVVPHAIVVGNPIRDELTRFPEPLLLSSDKELNILVLGGSRGAKAINEMMPALVESSAGKHWWHQTGESTYQQTLDNYGELNSSVRVSMFIDDMASAYRWADIVICRSGAMTVFEIMAVGKPAIFIPYPFAVDNHQHKNASYLVENGAALIIDQKALTLSALSDILTSVDQDRTLLFNMARAAYQLRKIKAAVLIKQVCLEII